jgi:putative ABC transport system permease protein
MVWFKLALKNILRRKTRSLFTLLGIAVAITVLYSLLEFQRNYERGLRDELYGLGAHIMVVPKGCPYEAATIALHGGKWPRYINEDKMDKIVKQPGVGKAAGIIMDALYDRQDNRNRIYLGIDENYPALRRDWKITGSWFPDSHSIILGSTVAAEEDKKPGDDYFLKEKNVTLRVSGVLQRTNSQDDGFYFLPRRTMQRIFGLEGKLVVILIQARDIEGIDRLTTAIKESDRDMNIFPLSELLANMTRIIQSTKVFIFAIVLVAVLTAMMGILNTILMAVFERTKEIGMMKAMGASRVDIFRLIWAETVIFGLGGGISGILISIVLAKVIAAFLITILPYAPKGTLIGFSWTALLASLIFSLVMGLVSGIYPALKASSVKPMIAIRTE